jgi:hypothetical protein
MVRCGPYPTAGLRGPWAEGRRLYFWRSFCDLPQGLVLSEQFRQMRSAVVDESASQFHSTKKTLITEHESPRTLPSYQHALLWAGGLLLPLFRAL